MANSKGNRKHTQNYSGPGTAKSAKIGKTKAQMAVKGAEPTDPTVTARESLRKKITERLETIKQRGKQILWDRECLLDLIAGTGDMIDAHDALANLHGSDYHGSTELESLPDVVRDFLFVPPVEISNNIHASPFTTTYSGEGAPLCDSYVLGTTIADGSLSMPGGGQSFHTCDKFSK